MSNELELLKLQVAQESNRLRGIETGTERGRLGIARVQTGMSLFGLVKPLLVGALILFFLVGPGIIGVVKLAGAVSWYWWVAFGVLILLFLRNN